MRSYLDRPLTATIAICVAVAMLWPVEHIEMPHRGADKVIHLLAFAALTLPFSRTQKYKMVYLVIAATLFGGVIEILQPFFGRHSDIGDVIADFIGALLGVILGKVYALWRARHT